MIVGWRSTLWVDLMVLTLSSNQLGWSMGLPSFVSSWLCNRFHKHKRRSKCNKTPGCSHDKTVCVPETMMVVQVANKDADYCCPGWWRRCKFDVSAAAAAAPLFVVRAAGMWISFCGLLGERAATAASKTLIKRTVVAQSCVNSRPAQQLHTDLTTSWFQ